MDVLKVGILGAGGIAGTMASTLSKMKDAAAYAVASRDIARAEAFAEKFGVGCAYGSYEAMLRDPEVDLVYVATPHSHHFEHMKMCIEHGKPVLCEKAFTANAAQAREIRDLAREKHVFVTEALWPRYMPSRDIIDSIVASDIVGKISMVTCNLSYDIDRVERIMRPELAGGALLDVGVYGLNFLIMHMGKEISKIECACSMTETGVDEREAISVFFESGVLGVTTHGIYGRSDRKGIFYCEKGYIVVENINNPRSIDVFDDSDRLIEHRDVPEQISGYEYEIEECRAAIEQGLTESRSMPLDESLFLMDVMDGIRKKMGLVYPFE